MHLLSGTAHIKQQKNNTQPTSKFRRLHSGRYCVKKKRETKRERKTTKSTYDVNDLCAQKNDNKKIYYNQFITRKLTYN